MVLFKGFPKNKWSCFRSSSCQDGTIFREEWWTPSLGYVLLADRFLDNLSVCVESSSNSDNSADSQLVNHVSGNSGIC